MEALCKSLKFITSTAQHCWPQKDFHCWIGAVLANQQGQGEQGVCECTEFTQCLGVEHPAPDLITSLVLIGIGTLTESQAGLVWKGP